MKWKDSDVDFEKSCVFIDEAGFNINMRSNWARSAIGTPAFVELEKTRAPSHTIIGAIHSSSVIHVAMKKPPTKKGEGLQNLRQIKVKNQKRESLQRANKERARSSLSNLW